MVAKASTAAASKRKKTEEMADSPPKRVTRARTAKVTEDVEVSSKATKVAKAPGKVAVDKKKAPAKATTTQKKATATKRKTQANNETETPIEEQVPKPDVAAEPKPRTTTGRGGRKKATVPMEEAENEIIDAPESHGQEASAAGVQAKTATTKSRGRPKKRQPAEPVENMEIAKPSETGESVEPVKKVRQGRTATTTKSDEPKASTRTRTTKKVQFQEDLDKENIPLQIEAPKRTAKSAMKPAGIQAKPVRKPAANRKTTRGRKAVKDEENVEHEQLPLSPKKIEQVAKSGSVSSEDELAGEKTPTKSPSKSPMKFQGSPVHILSAATAPSSPPKASPVHILASPIRRPPPSPFKDGLKMSPRKVDINFGVDKPGWQSTLSQTPAKPSLLQESPRKVKLQKDGATPALASAQSPMKASLLQSPARRPLMSPFKSQVKASGATTSKPASPIKLPSPPKPMRFSPQQAASSPLRAAKSPARKLQVHKITPQAQESQPIFEAPSPDMADSPCQTFSNENAFAEANIGIDTTMQDVEDVAPSEPQIAEGPTLSSAFTVKDEALRRVSMESGSTDELASPDKKFAPTPLRMNAVASRDFGTPSTAARAAVIEGSNDVSFTPLVGKLGEWAASSPNKKDHKASRQTRGVFSLGGAAAAGLKAESPLKEKSPAKTSFFEDEMAAMGDELDQAQDAIDAGFDIVAGGEAARIAVQTSMESEASEEYGDENAVPTEAEKIRSEQDNENTRTCTPAKVFIPATSTPAKVANQQAQEVHTVSKVPLRASTEASPLKVPRQRSKSIGGALSAVHELKNSSQKAAELPLPTQPETPKLAATLVPQTPSSEMKLDVETPGRTVRKGIVPDVLKGAIVYVDVHTTEGADASGIFVDLLTQMGARCVKQWNWNPRASIVNSLEGTASPTGDSPNASPSAGRVGITHVVYKDGGKRTLEKVRQSNGIVLCVGVGWVLE